MKKIISLSILSGSLLLFATAEGQYIYKPKTANSNKPVYQYAPAASQAKVPASSQVKATAPTGSSLTKITPATPHVVVDPPIVNDAIDVYTDNPILQKATLTVHFGNINTSSETVNFVLLGDPYYDYHPVNHISISNVNDNIRPNAAYEIPLYVNSDNHWTVTFQDFVTKWVDLAHTQLNANNRKNMQGGQVEIQAVGINGTVNKVILVLQFADGTKTIVWNNPVTFNTTVFFKFNQNFDPIN